MPPQVCAKCRGFPAQEGDSWCTGCIGWEALGRELTAHWDSEGGRHVANDLVVSTCRQVKALRSVTAGLTRSGGSVPEPRAGSSRARGDTRVPEPPAPPRRREAEGSPPKRACKEEELSEEDEGEESEEEERREERSPPRDADHKPIREHRPRSPPGPPPGDREYPGAKSIGLHRQREHRSGSKRKREHSHRREDRDSHRSGKRRGGRKHKRLHRLATNPELLVHRAPGRSFWELSTEQPGGGLDLSRLGR